MSPRAFQRRDFDELERRRMRGARLLHRGISQAEVARQVKVSRESVRRWANRMAQEGAAAALRKAGRAGRKPRLSEKQLQQLEARLREGAEKAGFPNGLWTLEPVLSASNSGWNIIPATCGGSCTRNSVGVASGR